ncbi:TPA: hypothetical protein HA249_01665 [Candidatus Woesearchaeota archaeon]|nr:hypothetical protein [Candidatus Woesearchaeota archaeon]HIH47951.1 hypothetical protein [Candidatus Woesearchaeota archaeon]
MGLDECIERCYDGLPADSHERDHVIDLLFEILETTADFQGWSPTDIKKLTKVGHHALSAVRERFTVPLLTKLYAANVDGATRSDRTREHQDHHGVVLEAHLHTYAADTAKLLYDITGRQQYLEAAYTHRLQAGHKTQSVESFHASHSYSFAAEYARELWNKTKDVNWAVRCYQSNWLVVVYASDQRHKAFAYLHAGEISEKLWNTTHQRSWLSRSVENYNGFLEFFDLASERQLTGLYRHAQRQHRKLSGLLRSQP